MNFLTDAKIEISLTVAPDGGHDVKRTIIGSFGVIVLAILSTMKLEPDFARAVEIAVRVYNDPSMPIDLKTKP